MSGILEDPITLVSPARLLCSIPSFLSTNLPTYLPSFFLFHLFPSSLVPEHQVSFENNPSLCILSCVVWVGLILLLPPGMGCDWLKLVIVSLPHRMFGSRGGQLSLFRKSETWDLSWECRATDTFSLGLWCEDARNCYSPTLTYSSSKKQKILTRFFVLLSPFKTGLIFCLIKFESSNWTRYPVLPEMIVYLSLFLLR